MRYQLAGFGPLRYIVRCCEDTDHGTVVHDWLSGAVGELSAHFTAGSSQPMHWKSVRPEIVTTGTIRFPHFGQRVIRSMRSSRIFYRNSELEFLFHERFGRNVGIRVHVRVLFGGEMSR